VASGFPSRFPTPELRARSVIGRFIIPPMRGMMMQELRRGGGGGLHTRERER